MDTRLSVFLYVVALLINVLSLTIAYMTDKLATLNALEGKFISGKALRFLPKFQKNAQSMYLFTFVADLSVLGAFLTESAMIAIALITKDNALKLVLGICIFTIAIGVAAAVTAMQKRRVRDLQRLQIMRAKAKNRKKKKK